jgi:hypothetical protein
VKQSNSSAGRRGLSTLFLSVGLLAATVGYLGLLARALVIDTSSTVDAATAALHNTEVQKLLTDRTADAVTSQLVGDSTVRDLAAFGIDVHRDLTPVAKTLLATPEFERAYADAVTQLHDHIFLDPTIAPTIDVTALVARARTEATAINPAYAQLIPPTATLVVTLPSDALPDLTAFDRQVTSSRTSLAIGLGVVMSAAAVALAAQRRMGRYLLTLAGLQLLLSIAVHVAIGRVSGDAAPILRAGVGAVLPRLVIPALVPLVGGVVAIITSIRLHRAEGGRVLADGRDAFLNDEAGQPTEWTFDAVFEPEVLRTAPSAASFQR